MKPTIRDILNTVKINTIEIDYGESTECVDAKRVTEDLLNKSVAGFVFDGLTKVRVWLREDN